MLGDENPKSGLFWKQRESFDDVEFVQRPSEWMSFPVSHFSSNSRLRFFFGLGVCFACLQILSSSLSVGMQSSMILRSETESDVPKSTNDNASLGSLDGITQTSSRSLAVDQGVSNHTDILARHNDFMDPNTTNVNLTAPACFVIAVYAANISKADKPPSVEEHSKANPDFKYFCYTNLPDLEAPGWEIVVHDKMFPGEDKAYKRFITYSRWPKFMAWKDPIVHTQCKTVFYMDAFALPSAPRETFLKEVDAILNHSVNTTKNIHNNNNNNNNNNNTAIPGAIGLAQHKHPHGGIKDELKRIKRYQKDIMPNIRKLRLWLHEQPDNYWNCTLYENTFFAYNPHDIHFRQASSFFWEHYSKEQFSWRDQPLWCYTIEHFHFRPIPLANRSILFTERKKNMGYGAKKHKRGPLAGIHTYTAEANDDAARLYNMSRSSSTKEVKDQSDKNQDKSGSTSASKSKEI